MARFLSSGKYSVKHIYTLEKNEGRGRYFHSHASSLGLGDTVEIQKRIVPVYNFKASDKWTGPKKRRLPAE